MAEQVGEVLPLPMAAATRREGWTGARVREAGLGLLLAAPPIVVLVLLIIVPALDALRFSLGIVPKGNITYSTGQHLIISDRPTLAVYRNLLNSQFFRDDFRLTAFVVIFS